MPGKPILIVEDDIDIRENLKELFENEGYTVELSANSEEALQLLRSGALKPGLVFLDLMMPVMDGRAFLASIEGDPPLKDLPVVVLTAASEYFTKHVVGFVRKPFDLDQVLTYAEKYCPIH